MNSTYQSGKSGHAPSYISSDRPLRSLKADKFGVGSQFIGRLARIALEWPSEDGLVIGLFGPWGIGKTSILNMFSDYVEQNRGQHKDVLIASFNPWFYEDTGALVISFFATIAEALGDVGDKPWAKGKTAFKALGAILAAAAKGITLFGVNVDAAMAVKSLKEAGEMSDSLSGLAELASGGQKKLDEQRDKVEEALRSLGENGGRVVVLVDDVDRLSKVELLSLLRLVRTVADLPYMTIVVAMDDERVRDVLGEAASEGYGQGFLDKIIQAPLHVPLPDREVMIAEIVANLKAAYAAVELPFPQELTPSMAGLSEELFVLASLVRTPRDLARYINGLRILLLAGEDPDVHPTDAALIEALRIFHPNVYDQVRRRKAFLTEREGSVVVFSTEEEIDSERERIAKEFDLIVRAGASMLDPKAEEVLRKLLKLLFGDLADALTEMSDMQNAAARRIRSSKFFDNYFRYASPLGALRRRDVDGIFCRILAKAEMNSEDGVVSELVTAFLGRNEAAKEQLVAEFGQRFLSVGFDLLARVANGILKAIGQLDQGVVFDLVEKVIAAETDSRRVMGDSQLTSAASESCYMTLRMVSKAKLPLEKIFSIFRGAYADWLGPERWLGLERFRELGGELLQRVSRELQAGDLFREQVDVRMAHVFKPAIVLSRKLGGSSPVSQQMLQSQVVDFVNRNPRVLPQVLSVFGGDNQDGAVLLVYPTYTEREASAALQEAFGDYKQLQPAYEQFQEGKLDTSPYYSRLLKEFGALLKTHVPVG